MPQPQVLILRAPGTNCELETAHAFELAGAAASVKHINRLLESPEMLQEFQILCIPGGFSFGDDIAAGRIFALRIGLQMSDRLQEFRDDDKLILGICNGFQVLARTGLLHEPVREEAEVAAMSSSHSQNGSQSEFSGSPSTNGHPADEHDADATLMLNDSGRFEDRWVHLSASAGHCVFLQGIERMFLPVAHAEGKFLVKDQPALDRLERAGRLPLRYAAGSSSRDSGNVAYPANPNGSMGNVAGMCDHTGRVFGLMPHPERHVDSMQHPYWTRLENLPEAGDGLKVFQNAVRYFD